MIREVYHTVLVYMYVSNCCLFFCFFFAVGEPLNDEAWLWYNNVVGGGKCTVVDTWWQTGKQRDV